MERKILKGTVGVFITAAIILSVAAGSGALVTSAADPNFYIRQGRVYGESDAPVLVAKIYDISEPISTGDRNVVLYFVDTGYGILMLEADRSDKTLASLADGQRSLAEEPAQIVAKVIPSHHSEVSDVLNSLGIPPEDKAQIEKNEFLSSHEVRSLRKGVMTGVGAAALFGAFFAGMGILRVSRNKSFFNTLFERYPELAKDLSLIRKDASFYDERSCLAIYKDHLITFRFGYQEVDLAEVEKIKYIMEHFIIYGGSQTRGLFEIYKKDGKKLKFYFRKDRHSSEEKIAESFRVIREKYPQIVF
ncbi:MAG: hypothetical protein Q4A75_08220 [Peptostreptococcaceae bacterium]|nr:hypothetical protein [Peptostreptococcaceae bacterium]